MSIPAIESWTPRELEDATKFNKRISDVHTFLQNPPTARMIGMARRQIKPGKFASLSFYPLGTEGSPVTSYETWPGMVPTSKDDNTMGVDTAWKFIVPVDGRYRITVNGAFNTGDSFAEKRHQLWVEVGVNPVSGLAPDVAAASVATLTPSQSTEYTLNGGGTTVQKLKAGDEVRFCCQLISASGKAFAWANVDVTPQYKFGSFAEIRWVGTV
ncbi:hypothetical protein ABWK57_13990 [Streptomyces sp. NPDC094045]|uniref:hypothetical protein n=1 Tax=unclassified Streptomyces TaxID=2593676 RepID=UPI0033967E14